VVFAGEDPIDAAWYNQRIDQAPLVTATGALYVAAHSEKLVNHHVSKAFLLARHHRLPVVLGMPLDLQKRRVRSDPYIPSRTIAPDLGARFPHPQQIAAAADRLRRAKRIVILAGRGARSAVAECTELSIKCDAALATTLPVRGLFTGNPRDVGVSGGFAHDVTREVFAEADLVIAVGTSLTQHTSDLNTLFTPDQVIQIDDAPPIIRHGQVPAGQHIVADASLALAALCDAVEDRTAQSHWNVADAAKRIHAEPPDSVEFQSVYGSLDPRDIAAALSRETSKHWAHVSSAGHCSYFATHLYGRSADDFLTIREFGAIGNGLSYAMGRWTACPTQPVMLTEGDGGLLMHIQELETVVRHKMKILICVFNDGAYGSEIHKLRADGISDHGAIFGFGDLAAIARGFGLDGHVISDLGRIPELTKAFEASEKAALWDFRVSDQVLAPTMRRQTGWRQ
jgi:thiamine pyrophosphate-dependent acetolactate synthase large subunit-like protein